MKQKKNKKIKAQSLKSKLIIASLFIGIAPVLILSIISSKIIKSSMYDSEIASLRQISSMITENLDKWGDNNIILVEDIASSQILDSNDLEKISIELKNKHGQDNSIYNIMYVDVSGNILADALGSKNANISSAEYFNDIKKEYSYVSDVMIDEEKNFPYIIFSSPVKQDNNIIGYIINKVKTTSIQDSIGNIFYSEEGHILTFNSNGYITYHSGSDKIINENIFDSSSELSNGAQRAMEGNFNSINYTYDGETGAAVYNFIPSLKWGTITTTPNSDIYSGFKNVIISAIPVVIFIIAAIVGIALFILKFVMKPVSQMVNLTKTVAQGDLTVQCDLNGSEEIVNIRNDLNEMVKSLRNLVLSIYNKSNELKDASVTLDELASSAQENSKDISKAMDEISTSSVNQASKTDDLLNNVRILDNKIIELTDKLDETNKALTISDTALSKGNDGTRQLKNNTEIQFGLVGDAVKEVQELAQFVSNIDEIIETISDIADQTSLLALNASIEAARAGESGKGFAVVALEVSKLANESQEATSKTAEILNSIRIKANKTTELMNSIDSGMKLQSATVSETIDIFSEITNADNKISDNIKSFNDLIDYIRNFSNDLLMLIETLASSSEESAAVAEEVTASSENQINVIQEVKKSGDIILKIVDELKSNIDKFKTE
ncbi:MAG: methyl-accepting chemotaxis protein [Clostridium sp.]